MLQVPRALVEEAMETMRRCGRGEDECVLFLVKHPASGELELLHPDHTPGSDGYTVRAEWLGRFAGSQITSKVQVVAQLHSQPGTAYHSATDDEYPMIGTAGFISIVVPRFGEGPFQMGQLYVAELQPDGAWKSI